MASKRQNTYKGRANGPGRKRAPRKKSAQQPFDWQDYAIDLSFLSDRRTHLSVGIALLGVAVVLLLSFASYLFTRKADQSVVESLSFTSLVASGHEVRNWLGLLGAGLSHLFIYRGFGLASLLLVPFLANIGMEVGFRRRLLPFRRTGSATLFLLFWLSLLSGYFVHVYPLETESAWYFLCGEIGLSMASTLDSLVGWGTTLLLAISAAIFGVFTFNLNVLSRYGQNAASGARNVGGAIAGGIRSAGPLFQVKTYREGEQPDKEKEKKPRTGKQKAETPQPGQAEPQEDSAPESPSAESQETTAKDKEKPFDTPSWEVDMKEVNAQTVSSRGEPEFSVEDLTGAEDAETVGTVKEDPTVPHKDDLQKMAEARDDSEEMPPYDPTLDLGSYRFPEPGILEEHEQSQKAKVTPAELEFNKNRIVETLNNFKIGITKIRATIGPTVTLYEIVPEAGVKISKIKNLEDDIALSLSALGIRIIAPIPGRGTIGIEVPNKHRKIVGMRSVLESKEFQQSSKELPIAIGRTISNEVFVTDLSKMPHLLMAGATGQGKSVGLNVILTCLLYKKHPAELKFVLVDPKKVEMSLYEKIERHYLAALPDAEEAIISDTKKAVQTLKSLTVEMDVRYSLLKTAGCRNLKEYNRKFVARKLNPQDGHRYLPYIVLVVDELADLMMTAGKEVEMPIARLAQLARAIGIHLILATQRPSVDVITGLIKANFPARISFKVSSRVDSRTILDSNGADQLVGMGDMLLSNGSDLVRLQCAFLDTDEVERICDFVSAQRGYQTAYLLPEYEEDDKERAAKEVDLKKRDSMFEEAAKVIVTHQQGSTSLIQRKLSLGYARAGRIMDQLEAAGIVGQFEGSKAREVLISTERELEDLIRIL